MLCDSGSELRLAPLQSCNVTYRHLALQIPGQRPAADPHYRLPLFQHLLKYSTRPDLRCGDDGGGVPSTTAGYMHVSTLHDGCIHALVRPIYRVAGDV